MHARRAANGSARPLNCGVRRHVKGHRMELEVAEKLSVLMMRIVAQLDQSTAYVRDNCSRKEFEDFRRVAGQVMGMIYVDIEEKLWAEHPQLRPQSLGGQYHVDDTVLGPPF
jgi:hypothetical protein